MCRIGYCPGCKSHGVVLTNHHKWKRSVWGRDKKKNGKTIWLCRPCHDVLEAEITRKENEILRQHPDIYIGTLDEFLVKAGSKEPEKATIEPVMAKKQKPMKVRYREKSESAIASFPQGLAMLI